MFPRRTIKTVFGQASRSSLYYLLIWHLPIRQAAARETGLDALGGLAVVGLLAGLVGLMRLLLTS